MFIKRHIFCIALVLSLSGAPELAGQNSMVGDGFGGRLWYKPYNYTVGSYSAYTICGDSQQLYGWGNNVFGQLGTGDYLGSSTPVKASGMTNVRLYTTGYCMGAIKVDGTAWVWGSPLKALPKKVLDSVRYMDAGMYSCSIVRYDGTVWSVGVNYSGSFGNGKTSNLIDSIPVKMLGMDSAVRVANGSGVNVVLMKDGTVRAAGNNGWGGLGNNACASCSSYKPVIVNGLKNIVDIKANTYTNIALDSAGDVYAWGYGGFGCIGNGKEYDVFEPQKIALLKNIVAISGCNDGYHFLALDDQGDCYAWGRASGTGYFMQSDVPVVVAQDVVDIMAGEIFSYIVKKDGTLWASGQSNGASIWMNLKDSSRILFTKIDPKVSPMFLCSAEPVNSRRTYATICKTDSIKFRGHFYSKTGIYSDTLKGSKGLDSIVFELTLTVNTSIEIETDIQFCEGGYGEYHGRKYSKTGIYFDTAINAHGCDTIFEITVMELRRNAVDSFIALCASSSYYFKGNFYNKDTILVDSLTNGLGCDSLVTYHLKFKPVSKTYNVLSICNGESHSVGGHVYSQPGLYSDTFVNRFGCDSIIVTKLSVDFVKADFTAKPTGNKILSFTNTSAGNANKYSWNFGHEPSYSRQKNVEHNYSPDTGYFKVCLLAKDSLLGCKDSICNWVHVMELGAKVFNVFTPDGDGINDVYKIEYTGLFNYDLKIFNRWGEKVYEVKNTSIQDEAKFWNGNVMNDGSQCPTGSYFCQFAFYFKGPDAPPETLTGSVTLIRNK